MSPVQLREPDVPAKNLDSVLFSDRERRGVRATKGTDFCTRDRQAERVQRRLIECPDLGHAGRLDMRSQAHARCRAVAASRIDWMKPAAEVPV